MVFADRKQAGKLLAERLGKFKGESCVVCALPRGGVVLGAEIAREYDWPMELILVRKIGHPYNPEYAVCAVSEGGVKYSEEGKESLDQGWLKKEMEKGRQEIKRRKEVYLGGRQAVAVGGKIAILVDDGVATGLTFLVAIEELRCRHPRKIVAALPVMPAEFEKKLKGAVDEVVCLNADENYLGSVGAYYMDFPQVTDEEVISVMTDMVI